MKRMIILPLLLAYSTASQCIEQGLGEYECAFFSASIPAFETGSTEHTQKWKFAVFHWDSIDPMDIMSGLGVRPIIVELSKEQVSNFDESSLDECHLPVCTQHCASMNCTVDNVHMPLPEEFIQPGYESFCKGWCGEEACVSLESVKSAPMHSGCNGRWSIAYDSGNRFECRLAMRNLETLNLSSKEVTVTALGDGEFEVPPSPECKTVSRACGGEYEPAGCRKALQPTLEERLAKEAGIEVERYPLSVMTCEPTNMYRTQRIRAIPPAGPGLMADDPGVGAANEPKLVGEVSQLERAEQSTRLAGYAIAEIVYGSTQIGRNEIEEIVLVLYSAALMNGRTKAEGARFASSVEAVLLELLEARLFSGHDTLKVLTPVVWGKSVREIPNQFFLYATMAHARNRLAELFGANSSTLQISLPPEDWDSIDSALSKTLPLAPTDVDRLSNMLSQFIGHRVDAFSGVSTENTKEVASKVFMPAAKAYYLLGSVDSPGSHDLRGVLGNILTATNPTAADAVFERFGPPQAGLFMGGAPSEDALRDGAFSTSSLAGEHVSGIDLFALRIGFMGLGPNVRRVVASGGLSRVEKRSVGEGEDFDGPRSDYEIANPYSGTSVGKIQEAMERGTAGPGQVAAGNFAGSFVREVAVQIVAEAVVTGMKKLYEAATDDLTSDTDSGGDPLGGVGDNDNTRDGSGDTDSGDTDSGDTDSGGTGSEGTGSEGTGSEGTGSGGTGSGGTGSGGTGSGGTGSGGTGSGGTDSGGTDSGESGNDDDDAKDDGARNAGERPTRKDSLDELICVSPEYESEPRSAEAVLQEIRFMTLRMEGIVYPPEEPVDGPFSEYIDLSSVALRITFATPVSPDAEPISSSGGGARDHPSWYTTPPDPN